MKRRGLTVSRLTLFCSSVVLLLTAVAVQASVIDAPHNDANGLNCASCHSYSLWWRYSPTTQSIDPTPGQIASATCNTCHDGSNAANGVMLSHSSATIGYTHGSAWDTSCVDCHDPHYQDQLNWAGSHSTQLFLVSGTIDAVTDNGDGTTNLLYSGALADNQNGDWTDRSRWGKKNDNPTLDRGLILVVNTATAKSTYQVVSATDTIIKVKGVVAITAPESFGLIYGQFIKQMVPVPNPPNGTANPREVKFFNPDTFYALGGFIDQETPNSGLCQVCHTVARHWTQDGANSDHNSTTKCTICHDRSLGFKPDVDNAHAFLSKSTTSCESCHDQDGNNNMITGIHKGHCTDCHNETTWERIVGPNAKGDATLHTEGNNSVCTVCHILDFGTTHNRYKSSPGPGELLRTHDPNVAADPACTACHIALTTPFSSSSTNQVHAAVGGCGACHNEGDGWRLQGSALNHTVGSVSTCATCHVGRVSGHASEHDMTAFDLAVPVEPSTLNCAGCHSGAVPNTNSYHLGLGTVKHGQVNGSGTIGAAITCDSCHQSTVQAVIDAIANGKGTNGATVACAACHSVRPATHPQEMSVAHPFLTKTGTTCESCHDQAGTADIVSNVHKSKCGNCHDLNTMALINGTRLAGAAGQTTLMIGDARKHTSGGDSNCIVCHVYDSSLTFNNTHYPSRNNRTHNPNVATEPNCLICHTATATPFTGANEAHGIVGCESCHDIFNGWRLYGSALNHTVGSVSICSTCHAENGTPPHGITVVPGSGCVNCHAAQVAKAETGHADCATCHQSTRPEVVAAIAAQVPTTCEACHIGSTEADIFHHVLGSTSCSDCHADNVAANAAGLHGTTAQACADCHTNLVGAAATATVPTFVVTDTTGAVVAGATVYAIPVAEVAALGAEPITLGADGNYSAAALNVDEPLEDLISGNFTPAGGGVTTYQQGVTGVDGKVELNNLPLGATDKFFIYVQPGAGDANRLPGGNLCRVAKTGLSFDDKVTAVKVSTKPSATATFVGTSACLSCHDDKKHMQETAHKNGFMAPGAPSGLQNTSQFDGDDGVYNLGAALAKYGPGDATSGGTTIYFSDYDATRKFDKFKTQETAPSGTVYATVRIYSNGGKYYAKFTNVINPSDPSSPMTQEVVLTYGGGVYKQRPITKVDDSLFMIPLQFNAMGDDASADRTRKVWRDYHLDWWWTANATPSLSTFKTKPAANNSVDVQCAPCHFNGYNVAKNATTGYYTAQGVADPNGELHPVLNQTQELNIGCETCHGPGSEHVAVGGVGVSIVTPQNTTPEREIIICGQCHSRPQGNDSFLIKKDSPLSATNQMMVAGTKRSDFLATNTSRHDASATAGDLWADGHSKSHHQQYTDFIQSSKYRNGSQLLTCASCHDLHAPGTDRHQLSGITDNSSCLSCHTEIEIGAHQVAKTGDTMGASVKCIECHNVKTSSSGAGSNPMTPVIDGTTKYYQGDISSHRFDVPAKTAATPTNTMPVPFNNNCGTCHAGHVGELAADSCVTCHDGKEAANAAGTHGTTAQACADCHTNLVGAAATATVPTFVVTDTTGAVVAGATVYAIPVAEVAALGAEPITLGADGNYSAAALNVDEPLEDLISGNFTPAGGGVTTYQQGVTGVDGKVELNNLPLGATDKFFIYVQPGAGDATRLPGGNLCRVAKTGLSFDDKVTAVKVSTKPSATATFVGTSACLSCHDDKKHMQETAHKNGFMAPGAPSGLQNTSQFDGDDGVYNLGAALAKYGPGDATSGGTTIYFSDYDATRKFDKFKTQETTPSGTVYATVRIYSNGGKYYAKFTNVINPSDPSSPMTQEVVLTYGGGVYKQRPITKVDDSLFMIPLQFNAMGDDASADRTRKVWRDYHLDWWWTANATPSLSTFKTKPAANNSVDVQCAPCHFNGYNVAKNATTGYYTAQGVADPNGELHPVLNQTQELNIGCETCHGPGSEHVAVGGVGVSIVTPQNTTPEREIIICGQCHSRPQGNDSFLIKKDSPLSATNTMMVAGTKRSDFLATNTSRHDASATAGDLWADGHSKSHHQQYTDFIQSSKYRNGSQLLTCASCHDLHAPGTDRHQLSGITDNSKCLSCHAEIEIGAHQVAKTGDTMGASVKCIECHNVKTSSSGAGSNPMTPVVGGTSGKNYYQGDISSHRFDVPVKAAATAAQMPVPYTNNCGTCHTATDL